MAGISILLALLAFTFLLKGAFVVSALLALPRTGGALFCTSHPAKIDAVLSAVPLENGARVMDLGCGDGRFLAAVFERYGVVGTGYEINLLAFLLARYRQGFRRKFQVLRKDFWKVSLGDADLIFCYLFPDVLERLAEKARREMRTGAVLVSCNFPLPGWTPFQVLQAGSVGALDSVYLYRQGESCPTVKRNDGAVLH